MNQLLTLRIRARLIAQLLIALAACSCWRLMSWARRAFKLLNDHSLGDDVRSGAVFAGGIVLLAAATILVGYLMYPLIRRRKGPLVSFYSLPFSVPLVLFGPWVLFATLDSIGFDTVRHDLTVYCFGAMLTATAGWDFWTAMHDDGSSRAIPAFLWMLAGQNILVALGWFQMYFE